MGGLICLSAVGGTTGDVRPLIALALALRGRGFAVMVIGDGAFERSALRAGLLASEWFSSSDVPQTFWLRTAAGQRWIWGRRARLRDRWMTREIARHRAQRMQEFWRRVGGPDNPAIVAAIGSISAFAMLGRFGPRCAKVISCPMPFQPSATFTLDAPDLSFVGRLGARIVRRRLMSRYGHQFCEEIFHLVSASPAVFPRPADWLPNMQVTGYMTLDQDLAGWTPPADLQAFLAAGTPPVYVGFGSLPMFVGRPGERLVREIKAGCRRRGVRCVIQSVDLPRTFAADDVFVLAEDAPHGWLFPGCAAIVHHGGYGTLHTALVAGRPTIIYPFQTDEFLWASRTGETGVGPGFTARLRHLSAQRLERDLDVVLRPECEGRAARLAVAVRAERGLSVQAAAIESIVDHTRCGGRPLDWRMPAVERDWRLEGGAR